MVYYQSNGSKKLVLKDIPTDAPKEHQDKDVNKAALKANVKKLKVLQSKLYAQNNYSLLLIFQALDAAGKDGMIRSVMSGLNPQGTQVFSFKGPSKEELDHDYLWRAHKAAPERGRVGIFNRSYYEDVLVVRVHNMLQNRQIPQHLITDNVWDERLADMVHFEDYMARNGQVTLKFYLHLSKQEQKRRFIARIDNAAKNWKFSAGDLQERKYWDDYQFAYQQAINKAASVDAPWYVIPADNKGYARHMVSNIIVDKLESLGLEYPKLPADEKARLADYRKQLMDE